MKTTTKDNQFVKTSWDIAERIADAIQIPMVQINHYTEEQTSIVRHSDYESKELMYRINGDKYIYIIYFKYDNHVMESNPKSYSVEGFLEYLSTFCSKEPSPFYYITDSILKAFASNLQERYDLEVINVKKGDTVVVYHERKKDGLIITYGYSEQNKLFTLITPASNDGYTYWYSVREFIKVIKNLMNEEVTPEQKSNFKELGASLIINPHPVKWIVDGATVELVVEENDYYYKVEYKRFAFVARTKKDIEEKIEAFDKVLKILENFNFKFKGEIK